MNSMFEIKKLKYHLRDTSIAVQPPYNTKTYGYRSFHYFGAKSWNSLPNHLKSITDLTIFKEGLHEWLEAESPTYLEIF